MATCLLHLYPYIPSILHQVFDMAKWGGAVSYFTIPTFLRLPLVLTPVSLAIVRTIGSQTNVPLEFIFTYAGIIIAMRICLHIWTLVLYFLGLILKKDADIIYPNVKKKATSKKKQPRKLFQARPYLRSVYRKCITKGFMPIYTSSGEYYSFMFYSVNASHSYLFGSPSRWNSLSLNKSIQWAHEKLNLPWSLLRGRADTLPEGPISTTIVIIISFAIPLCISIARINKLSFRQKHLAFKKFTLKLKYIIKFRRRTLLAIIVQLWICFLLKFLILTVHLFLDILWWTYSRCTIELCHIFSTKSKEQRKLLNLRKFILATNIEAGAKFVSFESEGATMVVDNAANVHVWSNKNDLINYSPIDKQMQGVSTIGSTPSLPHGTGDLPIAWKDNEGNLHSVTLKDVQHFPQSPVNIMSVARLADHFDDDYGTNCKTARYHSDFTWDHGKFERTLQHPTLTRIPELPVICGQERFKAFCTRFKALTDCQTSQVVCCTAITDLPSIANEGEDRTKYKIGENLIYFYDGKVLPVTLQEINVDGTTFTTSFRVSRIDGTEFVTSKEFIRYPDVKTISTIPRTAAHFSQDAEAHLTPDEMSRIAKPTKLTDLEIEYLRWHERLGHPSVKDFNSMINSGLLPTKFRKVLKDPPICISCIFGKMQRRKWRTSKDNYNPIRHESENYPGARVSVDQLISAQPGLVPRMEGGHTRARIWAATVFKDHFSDLIYTHLMTSPSLEETIAAKQAYEKFVNPTTIKSYHADNGTFAKEGFKDEIKEANQSITFCAVGAHHQSGIIERTIGELTHDARTMLLHAERYWPEMISPLLWPYALKAAEYKHNHLRLDNNGKSRMQKFFNSDVSSNIKLQHTFGCPVYVLESAQQNSVAGLPKWEPRCRIGIYLGHSPCHAGSVALILNPRTLHVSPQFHIVFDDEFTTVPFMRNEDEPPHWAKLVKESSELATDQEYELAKEWTSQGNIISDEGAPTLGNEGAPSTDTSENEGAEPIYRDRMRNGRILDSEDSDGEDDNDDFSTSSVSEGDANAESDKQMPKLTSLDETTLRRSKRIANKRSLFSMICLVSTALVTPHVSHPNSIFNQTFNHWEKVNQHFDGTLNDFHPLAFVSTATDNESYTVKQMLQQEDAPSFIEAMKKEVEDHEKREHWEIVPRSTMTSGKKTIMMVWSFKRKRYPDGRINKHKARLCAHGGMQQWGIDYWETYAPVVNWLSIRTLLAISLIHGLESRSIDFVLAFPQAPLEEEVFTELPYGFGVDEAYKRQHVIKLKKNLYGLKQAGFNWFEHLSKGLKNRGFSKSNIDPCIFYRGDAIIITYVDDCIVLYRNKSVFDELLDSLINGPEKFDLTDEGDINMYLGVEIEMHENPGENQQLTSFEMKQPFLIGRILDLLEVNEGDNSKPTPATKPVLTKDADGEPRFHDWNYRQAIGMMSYLTGSTRPDISMAVNQCARYCNDPKLSHERAVKRIARYLHGTKERGIIFTPDPKRGLECFVDADFAGGWNVLEPGNPNNVMSRTGFVIYYAGCPILWKSKLQTEIALSTTESEYIALSQALRDVIPMMALLLELNKLIDIHIPKPDIHCKVFEDNNSCIAVAESPKFTPRTKHIAIKYHHFRSFVKNKSINISHIGTKEQIADIFTKPLEGALFIYLRKKLSGW